MNLHRNGIHGTVLESVCRDSSDHLAALPNGPNGRALWRQRALLKVAPRDFLAVKVDRHAIIVRQHEPQLLKTLLFFRRALKGGAEIGGEGFLLGVVAEHEIGLHVLFSVSKRSLAFFPS